MIIYLLAYISPLFLGLVIPFLINPVKRETANMINTQKNQPKNRCFFTAIKSLTTTIVLFILVCLILGLANFLIAPNNCSLNAFTFFKLVLLLAGFALMITTIFYLLTSLGCPGNLAQLITSLLVILMISTVFYLNLLMEAFTGQETLRQLVIKFSINLNPMLVIASNFFNHDFLRSQHLYTPFYYRYPWWGNVLIGYLVGAFILGSVSILIKRQKCTV